jgi:TolB-like protein
VVLGLVMLIATGWALWTSQHPASRPDTLAQRRSIAVLPFANLSGDAAQDYFAEGITAQVIAEVSRLPETLVIAQPSTEGYSTSAVDVRRVGKELGVHFVVTGSVLRSAHEVRIQFRLSSADTQAVLWSDTLAYADDAPWTWSQDIRTRVAHALDLQITDVVGGWKPNAPAARDAIEHTMRGYSVLRRAATREELEAAAAEFHAALRSQPDSASAWAGSSIALSAMILNRFVPEPAAMLAQAEQAAGRALDPSYPNAHYAHGQVLLLRGQLEAALEAFNQSLRLNPSYTFAHARVAVILIEVGRAAEALQHAETALRLSPNDASLGALAHFAAGMALFHLGRDDESYAEMQKMVAGSPRIGFAYQWMAAIDALHGRQESARANLAQYRKLIAIQTVAGLKATERSRNPVFLAQRERFYDGLRLAGLPER